MMPLPIPEKTPPKTKTIFVFKTTYSPLEMLYLDAVVGTNWTYLINLIVQKLLLMAWQKAKWSDQSTKYKQDYDNLLKDAATC